jgi:outer membrane protein assembly factor BamB
LLYVISGGGVLNVFEAASGQLVHQMRVGDVASAYSASPVAADGRIYLPNEDGDVFVVEAGPECELLETNGMGEVILATPAISEGQIFVRTRHHLFALQDGVSSDAQ